MELSCPLRTQALSHKENLSCFGVLSHIINPSLTKLRLQYPAILTKQAWSITHMDHPELIGNVISVSLFTEPNHKHSNSNQVLINWMSHPAKQSRLLPAMLGSHKEATLQFLQMLG